MTPEELKREDEFLEAQAKAMRERLRRRRDGWPESISVPDATVEVDPGFYERLMER